MPIEVTPRTDIMQLHRFRNPRPNLVILLPHEATSPEFVSSLQAQNPDVEVLHFPVGEYYPTVKGHFEIPEADGVNAIKAVEVAVASLKKNGHVIVSCMHSMNRSPALGAVLYAWHYKVSLSEAMAAVKRAGRGGDWQRGTVRLFAGAIQHVTGEAIPGAPTEPIRFTGATKFHQSDPIVSRLADEVVFAEPRKHDTMPAVETTEPAKE